MINDKITLAHLESLASSFGINIPTDPTIVSSFMSNFSSFLESLGPDPSLKSSTAVMKLAVAKSEEEKMLATEVYNAMDPMLIFKRLKCASLLNEFNSMLIGDHSCLQQAMECLSEMLGGIGEKCFISQPFKCDIDVLKYFHNFGCVILDSSKVVIGNDVSIGPSVQIYTSLHSTNPKERRNFGSGFAKPVTIKDDVWIGGGVIILPGVTIGKGSTIGAGSVVTKDIPPYVVAVGNPARVIKFLDGSKDSI
ncbi:Maltose acetyltransferase [Nowakowskiella sp. JEL0078]|nr:Maltose acetyltransferase [Nowakowskiella sp. JEL0078]